MVKVLRARQGYLQEEQILTKREKAHQYEECNMHYADLKRVRGYAIQDETIAFMASFFNVAAAIAGETDFGKALKAIGSVGGQLAKFREAVTKAEMGKIQDQLQLLQDMKQDTQSHYHEIQNALQKLDEALLSIKRTEHEAKKQALKR